MQRIIFCFICDGQDGDLWVMTLCISERVRRIGETCCLNLRGRRTSQAKTKRNRRPGDFLLGDIFLRNVELSPNYTGTALKTVPFKYCLYLALLLVTDVVLPLFYKPLSIHSFKTTHWDPTVRIVSLPYCTRLLLAHNGTQLNCCHGKCTTLLCRRCHSGNIWQAGSSMANLDAGRGTGWSRDGEEGTYAPFTS
jgi:hypothetical protein